MQKKSKMKKMALNLVLVLAMIISLMPSFVQNVDAASGYAVRIDSSITNGTVTGGDGAHREGDTITLTVTPNAGYKLTELNVNKPKDIETVSELVGLMGDAEFEDRNEDGYSLKIVDGKFTAYHNAVEFAQLDSNATLNEGETSGEYGASSDGYFWAFDCYGERIAKVYLDDNSGNTYSFYGTNTGSLPAGDAIDDITTVEEGKTYTFTMPASDVRVRATFEVENPVKLTLYFSSMEGDDIEKPIVIKDIPSGTSISSALEKEDLDYFDELFTTKGYKDFGYRTPNPLSDYSDIDSLRVDDIEGNVQIANDMDVYVCMFKEIDEVEITVIHPAIGTKTEVPDGGLAWWDQTNPPEVPEVYISGEHYSFDYEDDKLPAIWVKNTYGDPFVGTFESGDYFAEVGLVSNFGYYFDCDDEDSYAGTVTVNDENPVGIWWNSYNSIRIFAKVSAVDVSYDNTKGDGSTWEIGSGKTLSFEFERNYDDDYKTFKEFDGALVDGDEITRDTDYIATSGSVIIELQPSFLKKLSVGEHELTAKFKDADDVTVKFYVANKKSDTTPAYVAPKTGIE